MGIPSARFNPRVRARARGEGWTSQMGETDQAPAGQGEWGGGTRRPRVQPSRARACARGKGGRSRRGEERDQAPAGHHSRGGGSSPCFNPRVRARARGGKGGRSRRGGLLVRLDHALPAAGQCPHAAPVIEVEHAVLAHPGHAHGDGPGSSVMPRAVRDEDATELSRSVGCGHA